MQHTCPTWQMAAKAEEVQQHRQQEQESRSTSQLEWLLWLAQSRYKVEILPLFLPAGWAGWVKYWLMPWLGYHFWMSTFTVVRGTGARLLRPWWLPPAAATNACCSLQLLLESKQLALDAHAQPHLNPCSAGAPHRAARPLQARV